MVDAKQRDTKWPWLTLAQGYRYSALLGKYRRRRRNATLLNFAVRNNALRTGYSRFGIFFAEFPYVRTKHGALHVGEFAYEVIHTQHPTAGPTYTVMGNGQ